MAGESGDGIGKGCRTGCDCKGRDTAFEGGYAFFKNILRRVGETAINIAGIFQMETVRSVLSAVENVRGGLVYRNRAGIGGGIGLFLANVELKRFEVEFVLCCHFLSPFRAFGAVVGKLVPHFYKPGPSQADLSSASLITVTHSNFHKLSCLCWASFSPDRG
jgi:hypothetical protein